MSQHFYNTAVNGKNVEVLMGWDRPMQQYFLVVTDLDSGTDDHLYSNLNDPASYGQQRLDYFVKVLNAMNIEVPPAMLVEVEVDYLMNRGNLVRWHEVANASSGGAFEFDDGAPA